MRYAGSYTSRATSNRIQHTLQHGCVALFISVLLGVYRGCMVAVMCCYKRHMIIEAFACKLNNWTSNQGFDGFKRLPAWQLSFPRH
jgi:hypothetical protein